MGFGLCEEAGLVVEPDRRMRVIGGQGVIVVEVDPKGLSYEDDVFAVRGVRRAAGAAAGLDRRRPRGRRATVPAGPAALTIERLVSGLRREVGAGGAAGARRRAGSASRWTPRPALGGPARHREQPRRRLTAAGSARGRGDAAGRAGSAGGPAERPRHRRVRSGQPHLLSRAPTSICRARPWCSTWRSPAVPSPCRWPTMSRRWPRSIRISPAPPSPTMPICSRAWSRWSSRLDIGLHLDRFSVHPRGRFDRVATQALDRRTQHRAVYFVWDWLEAIGAGDALRPRRRHGQAAGAVQPLALSAAPPPTRSCAPPTRAASPPSICATRA